MVSAPPALSARSSDRDQATGETWSQPRPVVVARLSLKTNENTSGVEMAPFTDGDEEGSPAHLRALMASDTYVQPGGAYARSKRIRSES